MDLEQPHILIIDDDANINRALLRVLRKDFFVATTTSIKEGLNIIKQSHPFLAMVDLKMPEASGIEVLKELKRVEPEIAVIIMSAYDEINSVIEALKCGATDFLTKPFENGVLLEKIKRLATMKYFEKKSLLPQVKGIVGESPAIKHVWELIKRFASSDITILLQGETGTGKELFANVIHCMSLRNRGPFVPVDCSAFPESILESELFGYEKGAFTGADRKRIGLFESANNGTLFLDEIGNLPRTIQAKLLRVIQERSLSRLGSDGYVPVHLNIRIIAATNINLEEASKKGGFRQDLYYRLSTATITLPPLRERQGDIPRLINNFLTKCCREYNKSVEITDEALSLLNSYQWPGNVRELESVIKSAFLIADDFIQPCHFPQIIKEEKRLNDHSSSPQITSELRRPMCKDFIDVKTLRNIAEEAERQAILQVIKNNPFINKTALARLLKVDPKTLRSRLKRFGFNSE